METQTPASKSLHPLTWAAGIALILFSAVGIGAVGGAVAGNEIEKHVKSTKSYETTVRFDDGSSRAFTEASAPSWRNGDKVKVINGVIQSNV